MSPRFSSARRRAIRGQLLTPLARITRDFRA
jgi:hypothetical protein